MNDWMLCECLLPLKKKVQRTFQHNVLKLIPALVQVIHWITQSVGMTDRCVCVCVCVCVCEGQGRNQHEG